MTVMDKYLLEGEEKKQNLTLYHGVKKAENVDKILKGGFKLIHINPLWQNDYAISAVRTKKQVADFFGRRIVTVLKFKFSGNVFMLDQFDTIGPEYVGFPNSPQQYTRNLVKEGIDAVALHGGIQYFIYNPKKISNIQVVK